MTCMLTTGSTMRQNGWNNTDGDNNNNSWNCGEEGESMNPEVLALRNRMRKNSFAVLMCSRGAADVPCRRRILQYAVWQQ